MLSADGGRSLITPSGLPTEPPPLADGPPIDTSPPAPKALTVQGGNATVIDPWTTDALATSQVGEAPGKPSKLKIAVGTVGLGLVGVGADIALRHFVPAYAGIADIAGPGVSAGVLGVGGALTGALAFGGKAAAGSGLVTDQEGYDKAFGKQGRGEWWKSTLLFAGGTLGSGALGIAVDLGLQKFVPSYAGMVNTALSPALWGISGSLAGALTFLFTQKVTEPTAALANKWAAKGTPIQFDGNAATIQDLVRSNTASNGIDSRAGVGMAQVDGFIQNVKLIQPMIFDRLNKAEKAGFAGRAEELKLVGRALGRELIWDESGYFAVVPQFKEIFTKVRIALHAVFEGLHEADYQAIEAGALEVIRENRPPPTDPKIPPVEKAIENYFKPIIVAVAHPKGA